MRTDFWRSACAFLCNKYELTVVRVIFGRFFVVVPHVLKESFILKFLRKINLLAATCRWLASANCACCRHEVSRNHVECAELPISGMHLMLLPCCSHLRPGGWFEDTSNALLTEGCGVAQVWLGVQTRYLARTGVRANIIVRRCKWYRFPDELGHYLLRNIRNKVISPIRSGITYICEGRFRWQNLPIRCCLAFTNIASSLQYLTCPRNIA